MQKLKLAFFWHMHQPFYKDNANGEYYMPWVFLHAIKDYYELPYLFSKFGVKATFNLVPSLLVQLKDYAQSLENDRLLNLILKDVNELTNAEKAFISKDCFHSHKENMIAPLPRYLELFNKKDNGFNAYELLDLEVLFILSWCGNYLRQNNKVVQNLLLKGRGFSHAEKLELLEVLRIFVGSIIERYKNLEKNHEISIFTTPFYHPITPILLDPAAAQKSKRSTPLAQIHQMADFAKMHTQRAIKEYEANFDNAPTGFWPAEGAISYETLNLFFEHNIRYALSDEEILFNSGIKNRQDLYKPYKIALKNGAINMLFRDKFLSDLIGFTYSNISPDLAVSEFVGHLKAIYEANNQAVVGVFLDGENAWEYYPNNAFYFFEKLLETIKSTDWIEDTLITDIDFSNAQELLQIATGSWIGGNLDTWMGHAQKNKAWELLSFVYSDFLSFRHTLENSVQEKCQEEILIAQGSDWFWWYGDDHYTPLAFEFDYLFRKHLQNVYFFASKEIPKELLEPIVKQESSTKDRLPTSLLSPTINGLENGFLEWMGAGFKDLSTEYSVMDSSAGLIKSIDYATDLQNVFIRFLASKALLNKTLELHIIGEKTKIISMDLNEKKFKNNDYSYALDEYFEMSFNMQSFGITDFVDLYFYVKENSQIIEKAPPYKEARLSLNSGYDAIWYI